MELSIVEKYVLIALDGQDSRYKTNSKVMILRSLLAGVVLELYLEEELVKVEDVIQIKSESYTEKVYQKVVIDKLRKEKKLRKASLNTWMKVASGLKYSAKEEVEHCVIQPLMNKGLVKEVPNLLGCDVDYVTAGIILKAYATREDIYTREISIIKAELLEEDLLTDESLVLVWLLRESGCLSHLLSKEEQQQVEAKMSNLYHNKENQLAQTLLPIQIHEGLELGIKTLLNVKRDMMRTQTGTGVNFVFPMLEKKESIFIETEAMFPSAKDRLEDLKKRLTENGHEYEVIREGDVPLIKIVNVYYEAIPDSRKGRVTIHGIRLRRYKL